MTYQKIEECRACHSPQLKVVLDLGSHYPSRFLESDQSPIDQKVPLVLVQCGKCQLVQLQHTVTLDLMYRQYWYKSSLNSSMQKALYQVALSAEVELGKYLQHGDVIVDIACNDGHLLSYFYQKGYTLVGFDPALNVVEEASQWCDLFINDYFSAADYPLWNKAKLVTSIAMFYDLPDPSAFVQDVRSILHEDGLWILQLTDLVSMLRLNAFDAICHEHLEYYSLRWLVDFLATFSLDVFSVDRNDVNGGSLRLYICHQGKRSIDHTVDWHLQEEGRYLSGFENPMLAFKERIYQCQIETMHLLHQLRAEGKRVYGLAASTKGNTLLQFYGINQRLLQKIADVNPDKFGCRTIGTGIEIVDEQIALQEKPDYFFILAWGFLPFFLEKFEDYMKAGGKLIVPLPEPRIYQWEKGNTLWTSAEKASVN